MNQTEDPFAYFITFSCYGSRLHGDARGSVDRQQNEYNTPPLPPCLHRLRAGRARMKEPDYEMDAARRDLVLEGIRECCRRRGWRLVAAHVRARHVHGVVQGTTPPERMMSAMKAYASRYLNLAGLDPADPKRWSRHGSTIYLWTPGQLDQAVDYVVHKQGTPMAVFVDSAALSLAPSVPRTSVPRTSVPRTSVPRTSVPRTSVPRTE